MFFTMLGTVLMILVSYAVPIAILVCLILIVRWLYQHK